ncbi:MAG: hypothetical protein M3081_21305 [Gemmatimonadota bacterium]|nr:hypothetical protein [Gemmatimonadota bacterium]
MHKRRHSAVGSRRGLALPVVLLATALMTVALAVTFTAVGTERHVTNNYKAQLLAFSLAETGLERCTSDRAACGFVAGAPTLAYDSARLALPGGFADVVYERLRPPVGATKGIYLVRSRGVATRLGTSRDPLAERTVAQLATASANAFAALSALTTLNGASLNVTKDTVTGMPPGTCLQPNTFGAAYPAGAFAGPFVTGGARVLGPTSSSASDSVDVDWAGIVSGNVLSPDVNYPGDPWPGVGWHVIRATGSLTVNSGMSGSGLLIVTGGLTINGSWNWNGVILVGGAITGSTGNHMIDGAVVSGLNQKLGTPVGTLSNFGSDTTRIRYNPCMVDSAVATMSTWGVYRNAWTDAWRSY